VSLVVLLFKLKLQSSYTGKREIIITTP